jgi:3-phosphoshikimate 1-carboxyvinyltransferase
VRGAAELRVKESDRIAAVVDGPARLGRRSRRPRTASSCAARRAARRAIDARGDHRLAMLGAVAGLASREGVEFAEWRPRGLVSLGSWTTWPA